MARIVIDTSVLIQSTQKLETLVADNELIVCSTVASELDNMKESDNPRRAFNGRTGLRFIEKYEKDLTFVVSDIVDKLPEEYLKNENDNKIINCAIKNDASLATKDKGMLIKCWALGIDTIKMSEAGNKMRTGYKILELDTRVEKDNEILASVYENNFTHIDLKENEYLIIRDLSCPNYKITEDNEEFLGYRTIEIKRFSNGSLVDLRMPPKSVIEPRNDLQKCAIDLAYCKDIPIKMILGTYGSGKTKICATLAHYMTMEKEKYSKMHFIRQPIGAGKEVGFLSGSLNDKTSEFFMPLVGHMKDYIQDPAVYAESLKMRDKLKMSIPYYLKGVDIKDSFIVVDEAEDFTTENIKLIGSRVSEGSCIAFSGDYAQAEKEYKNNSGIMTFLDGVVNNPLVGVVVMDLDVRSEASKVFADL